MYSRLCSESCNSNAWHLSALTRGRTCENKKETSGVTASQCLQPPKGVFSTRLEGNPTNSMGMIFLFGQRDPRRP